MVGRPSFAGLLNPAMSRMKVKPLKSAVFTIGLCTFKPRRVGAGGLGSVLLNPFRVLRSRLCFFISSK